jgi:hypothetical protein
MLTNRLKQRNMLFEDYDRLPPGIARSTAARFF